MYSQKTTLRAVISSIPWIGSPLDLVLSSEGQKIVQARVMQMLKDLEREMGGMQESMVDKRYLGSEEFFDLILKAIEAAARTREREKIRIYARVLKGAVTIQDREGTSPEEYLAILSELTLREIQMARVVYEQSERAPKTGTLLSKREKRIAQLSKRCPSIPRDDLQFILLRLQRSGLMYEMVGTYAGYTGGTYIITQVFHKLMDYLEGSSSDG